MCYDNTNLIMAVLLLTLFVNFCDVTGTSHARTPMKPEDLSQHESSIASKSSSNFSRKTGNSEESFIEKGSPEQNVHRDDNNDDASDRGSAEKNQRPGRNIENDMKYHSGPNFSQKINVHSKENSGLVYNASFRHSLENYENLENHENLGGYYRQNKGTVFENYSVNPMENASQLDNIMSKVLDRSKRNGMQDFIEKNDSSATSSAEINETTLDLFGFDHEMEHRLPQNLESKGNTEFLQDLDTIYERDDRNQDQSNFYDENLTYSENDTMDFNLTGISEEEHLQVLLEIIWPKTWTWILIVFHTLVFVIGLVGNILVCIAVYRNHTMRTVTNYFIVNLAVADFLVILCCLPFSVVWDVTLTWFFGVAVCKIVLYLQSVSVTVSVLTLTFISIDRWYAICFPLKFKSTTGRAKTAIWIIWIVALVCDIPEMLYLTTVRGVTVIDTIYMTQCLPTWSIATDTVYVILKMMLFYMIPLVLMSVAYVQIIRVLWKSGNVPHPMIDVTGNRQVNTFAMNMNASTEGQLRSRRKAAKMLVAVVGMFLFCYFPVHLLSILRLTVGMKNTDGSRAFSLISHWLCYANSAVNPIIYNFMSGKFRKEFHRAFEHCCQKRSSSNGSRTSTKIHGSHQFNAIYHKNQDKDSGIVSRSHSRTDMEIQRVNTYEFQTNLQRKGTTKTSTMTVEL